MLTERQKTALENQIYRMLKESIFENGYFENGYFENKRKERDGDDDDYDDNESEKHGSHDENIEHKREIVMKWLDSDLELHSTLAYELFPDKVSNDTKKGEARSLFSKKYRGHDDTGKPYSFDDDEINKLYNLRNKYIKQRGFDKK